MTGPAVGAPGGSTIPQFRNVYYGTEALTPGSSPLPEGTLYITPEMEYEGAGKRTCRFVVGTSTAGWTVADCDYLCDGTADDVEINAAIQALPSTGGEIVILDGTYNIISSITVNKSNVTLSGNGAATILLRSANIDVVFLSGVTNCKVRDLAIDGNKIDYTSNNSCIYLSTASNNIITGNICYNNYYGVFLPYNASNNVIMGNACNNNNVGIYLSSSNVNNNTIAGNTCSNNSSYGINLYRSGSNNTITGNTCNDSQYAITLNSSSNNTITGNTCNNSYNGITLTSSSNNTVTGNTCNNNSYNGITLTSSSNNTITGNTCNNNNSSGINMFSSSNNTVTGNTCVRGTGQTSDYASNQNTIYVISAASNNLFTGNNIMGKNYVDNGSNNTWANNKFE